MVQTLPESSTRAFVKQELHLDRRQPKLQQWRTRLVKAERLENDAFEHQPSSPHSPHELGPAEADAWARLVAGYLAGVGASIKGERVDVIRVLLLPPPCPPAPDVAVGMGFIPPPGRGMDWG